MLMMLLSVQTRWPLSKSETPISLKVLVFRECFSSTSQPPANFKSTETWETMAERGEERGGERERSVLRDTTRTSPRSHMVVEMVLYGCVFLPVPFKIFTGKCLRPAVCNNITPPLCFPLLLFFCGFFVSAAVLKISPPHKAFWLMAAVDSAVDTYLGGRGWSGSYK